jgi:hypothetical protein
MKRFLAIPINLFIFIGYFIWGIIGIIWYGRLPKISPYHKHRWKPEDTNLSELYFEDENYQHRLPIEDSTLELMPFRSDLVGLKFKRNKYGLSEWTETINKVWIGWEINYATKTRKPKFMINGGGDGTIPYELDEIVIVNE